MTLSLAPDPSASCRDSRQRGDRADLSRVSCASVAADCASEPPTDADAVVAPLVEAGLDSLVMARHRSRAASIFAEGQQAFSPDRSDLQVGHDASTAGTQ